MTKRILIVEDQEDNRQIMQDLLESAGFEVVIAVNGREGVAKAAADKPDLVLMDIQLPGLDGYEAARLIKDSEGLGETPIIAVTSYALGDDRIKALVAWGVMYHLRNLAEVPTHTLEGFLFVSGSATLDQARAFYQCIDLDGYAEKIRCPTMVVHGGLDAITPAENATMLLDKLETEVETLIWDDSIHCCHDRAHIVRPAMADFMARHL